MGSIIGLLVNSPVVGKVPHHLETHCDCKCSESSDESNEPKKESTTKHDKT